jgi:hypothetical protein
LEAHGGAFWIWGKAAILKVRPSVEAPVALQVAT